LQRPDDGPEYIIGGIDLGPHSRPYLVSIGNALSGHNCGGTLISPNAVLTSAHCFDDNGTFAPLDWVDFNRHNLTDNTAVLRMFLSPIENVNVVKHPDYSKELTDNDFAVILLPYPMRDIVPVELNDEHTVPVSEDVLETFGWGAIGYKDTDNPPYEYPNIPQTTFVSYVPNDECMTLPYTWAPGQITSNMMCAYGSGTSAPCVGDSGTLPSLSHISDFYLKTPTIPLTHFFSFFYSRGICRWSNCQIYAVWSCTSRHY